MDTESIRRDLKESMKAKDEARTGTLRMLLAAVFNKEKEKQYAASKKNSALSREEISQKSKLITEEVVDVVVAEVKKRREAAVEFQRGGRRDLATKELAEAALLVSYLPPQLSEQELKTLVKEAVLKSGASSVRDMGKVMALLALSTKGRADGATVSAMVKELLGS